MKLGLGLILFAITTVLGILFLIENCEYCDNATAIFENQMTIVNGIIWIVSIVLIVSGLKERSKNIESDKQKFLEKELEKESKKDIEFKELKEKVELLEKDKKKEDDS